MEASKKVIIYDDTCPLCNWYTQQFINHGLLAEDGRQSFTALNKTGLQEQLDQERSRHEIPLVDRDGGEVLYGLDSLLFILDQHFHRLVRMAKISPINFFFQKL